MRKNNHEVTSLAVLAGKFKGQNILSPRSSSTHPMGAREKLALFNMLFGDLVLEARVLDLYAGSGALGIEALSRGVREVQFVEKNSSAASTIRQNLKNLDLAGTVWCESAQDFIKRPKFANYFSIIIADPPYDNFDIKELDGIENLLTPDGALMLSSPSRLPAPEIPGLGLISSHIYAAARLTLYRKPNF